MEDIAKRHIGHQLRMLNNGLEKCFSCRQISPNEIRLTHAQCGIMHYLYDHRDQTVFQRDIEKYFQISGATASNTLKGMEKQKVIERKAMDSDARKKAITMTEYGIEIHESALVGVERVEKILTEGMTEEEITIFRDLLSRAIQNVDAATAELCGKK